MKQKYSTLLLLTRKQERVDEAIRNIDSAKTQNVNLYALPNFASVILILFKSVCWLVKPVLLDI